MKVGLKDKTDKTTAGEMRGGSGEMGRLVGEMLTEPAKLKDFGFSDEVVARANTIKEALKDDEPFISIVRVEEGWSRSRRLWPAREIDRIVEQTNTLEPVGHLGHIPDEDEATAMPEPQTTWVGAFAKTEPSKSKERAGEMVRVAYFAGYNHPRAKIRDIIKARAVRGISWWGKALQVPIPGRGVEMKEFDLQALDWARKLAEGMPTSSVVAIASEMQRSDKMDKELSQVTPAEFKEHNPNGYALLRAEVEGEHKTTVAEMQTKVDEGESAKSLLAKACTLLGIEKPEEIEAKITDLKSKIGDRAKATLAAGLDAILAEKLPGEENKDKRALVARLLPVGEMESKVADATEEDAKKTIGEMVDAAFNTDDTIKTIVGEQSAPVLRRREELQSGAGLGSDNPYVGERARVSV